MSEKVIRTFRIDEDLWNKYRVYAFQKKKPVSALLREHIVDDLTQAGILEKIEEGGILE